jgi:hypothetical protein
MGWVCRIGQGGSIRTQDRVVDVRVTEEFAHQEFVVTIKNPTATDRAQAKGRVDAAIIEIKRGSDTLIEGFIEDIEKGPNTIKYIGRSFLVLAGYTTSSLTSSGGVTEAEYTDKTGAFIIDDLLDTFCYPNDNELVYTDLTFADTYGGEVKLHGKKVYDIIRNMCIDHTKDLWADATWTGDNVTAKNIHVGTKSRGSVGAPNKTLYGGIHLKSIPTVKYRSSQNVINRIRVNGKGTGKDKVSIVVNDAASQTTYGVIEGAPYNNNMIVDEATATTIGEAIIAAKKDLVEEIHVDLIQYLSDLKYGDWVRIVDSYSFVDTTQRIKKITRSYNDQQGESISIEVGMPFDNYETLIKDLTKGDVDAEPEMTKLGGAFTITANDPASSYVRHDKGDWYDTTGTFQSKSKGVCAFWEYADNPATGTYKKALIQISNAEAVSYKVGSQESTANAAEATTVSADALNTPIGEVILKGKAVGGGGYTVEDVYSSDESGKSYIYKDVRPIVGSSSSGYGGDVSNPLTENLAAGGYKITGLGAAVSSGDAISLDGDGYVPIAKLPLGGTGLKGGLLVGKETGCDSMLPGTNTHVLTLDSTEAFGMKWAAAGAEGLWEIDGSETQLITADDIDMRARGFMHVSSLQPEYAAGIEIFDNAGNSRAYLGTTIYALSAHKNIYMNGSWKIQGLAAGSAAGDSIRYDEYSIHNHDGCYYTETEINTWRNGTTQTEMGYMNEVSSSIQDQLNARLPLTAGSGKPLSGDLYMGGNDIIGIDKLQGTTGVPLKIEFKGDTNYRMYVDGTTPYYNRYQTVTAHEFDIGAAAICYISSVGITMAAGKYIKSTSGDLELRAPSGSNIKFVIG